MQRYPEDFNGVVTGCTLINNTINKGLYQAWNIPTTTRPDGTLIITSDELPLLHKAVLDECDALDGAKDGLISDPFGCHPMLTEIECKTTLDTYANAVTPSKRRAHERIVDGLLAADPSGKVLNLPNQL